MDVVHYHTAALSTSSFIINGSDPAPNVGGIPSKPRMNVVVCICMSYPLAGTLQGKDCLGFRGHGHNIPILKPFCAKVLSHRDIGIGKGI